MDEAAPDSRCSVFANPLVLSLPDWGSAKSRDIFSSLSSSIDARRLPRVGEIDRALFSSSSDAKKKNDSQLLVSRVGSNAGCDKHSVETSSFNVFSSMVALNPLKLACLPLGMKGILPAPGCQGT
jgi:hypothetical protein